MHHAGIAPIRVLLDLNGWRADSVLQSLSAATDLDVVHRAVAAAPAGMLLPDPFDVVVVSHRSEGFERLKRSFFSDAGIAVVAINEENDCVEIYDRWVVREVKVMDLVSAIREVARHRESHEGATRAR